MVDDSHDEIPDEHWVGTLACWSASGPAAAT